MYPEDDFIQLSALQHFVFCKRQCALIHIEQAWSENRFTAEGKIMHDKVHEGPSETQKDTRITRGLVLHSFALGLSAKADVVEFHRTENGGNWVPFPVEYKRGKPKRDDCDKVQLCAQTLCLEEMLKVTIPCGAIFYGKTRHRLDVVFDDALRQKTIEIAKQLHVFIDAGNTPMPIYTEKCDSCSFVDECLPKPIGRKIPVKEYLQKELSKACSEPRLKRDESK
ncbi:MAG: CRISPR-associated protein Cas4 [Planctomycetota bacterium]